MLNSEQQQFCDLPGGKAIRLLAPAGCGKTQSILWRCKSLVERAVAAGTSPPRMLLFTFTRAAREELQTRVGTDPTFAALGAHLRIATLNAWGYRRLRAQHSGLKLISDRVQLHFALFNTLRPIWMKYPHVKAILEDKRRASRAGRDIMKLFDSLKSLGFRHWELKGPDDVARLFESLRDIGMGAHVFEIENTLRKLEFLDDSEAPVEQIYNNFIRFWCEAVASLHGMAIITLEDQKYLALKDLTEQLASGNTWAGAAGYDEILVDEFQDINPLDLDLLKTLSALTRAPLTIVGDDDQAIYEWRGASPSYILEPDQRIAPDFQTCILSTNYRSPRNIVDLSQRLIRHNLRRVDKDVRAHTTADARVEIHPVTDIHSAIDHVVALVEARQADSGPEHRVALIGRKRAQLIPYQIAFAARDIPFYAAEDLSIFLSDAFDSLIQVLEVRTAIAARVGQAWGFEPASMILKMCDNINRYPLSKTDNAALRRHLQTARPQTLNDALVALRRYEGNMRQPAEAIAEILAALFATKTVPEALGVISLRFEGLQQDYGRAEDDIFYSDPPFMHLADYAAAYGEDFSRFVSDLRAARDTLARPLPQDDETPDDTTQRPVHLMTALRAKGKEFETVVILDANTDIWPSRLATTERQLEAERRVFYVAVTRAKEHLLFLPARILRDEIGVPTPYLTEMGLI